MAGFTVIKFHSFMSLQEHQDAEGPPFQETHGRKQGEI